MGAFDFLNFSTETVSDQPIRNVIPPDPDFNEGAPVTSNPTAGVEHPCENFETCGNPIVYSGRGRKPKLCPECKGQTRGTNVPRMPRVASLDKRKQKVADNLMEIAGILGGSVTFAAPVTGNTIVATSPPAIASLVEIAAEHPKMLNGLEKITEVMPWVSIGRFAGAVGYAMAVDAGRIEPTGLVAEYLGVAEVAERMGWQPNQQDEPEQPEIPNLGIQIASPRRFVMPDGA